MSNDSGSLGGRVTAVMAGFIATAALSIGTDTALRNLGFFPPSGEPMATSLYVVATVYRMAFTVFGGYVTAALTPGRALIPVIVLGAIGELVALGGAAATWNAGPEFGPHWYPLALVFTGVPCVLLGLVLRRGLPFTQA